jgi:glycosyltransferase involved in cell wall biosynthesis
MALRKPVITTDLKGGSRELIADGETGFCIKRDIQEAVAKINLLIDDETTRLSMGEKGESRIRSLFSVERMGREFVELYNEFV